MRVCVIVVLIKRECENVEVCACMLVYGFRAQLAAYVCVRVYIYVCAHVDFVCCLRNRAYVYIYIYSYVYMYIERPCMCVSKCVLLHKWVCVGVCGCACVRACTCATHEIATCSADTVLPIEFQSLFIDLGFFFKIYVSFARYRCLFICRHVFSQRCGSHFIHMCINMYDMIRFIHMV